MLGIWLPMLLLLGFFFFLFLRESGPSDPATLAKSLEITGSKMEYSSGRNGRAYVTIVGTLRNKSGSTLESPHFAVRFYDAAGELIDSLAVNEFALVLASGVEQAFTLQGVAVKPESEYSRYEIEVTGASPGRSF